MTHPKPGIIGVLGLGRFGKALAASLHSLGLSLRLRDRQTSDPLSSWHRDCQVLCLAVRDDQLPQVIARLASLDNQGKTVLIHSGSWPLSGLKPLQETGARVGKFHPLQAFTGSQTAIPPGTPWACEGPIEELVTPWVHAWGGRLHQLQGDQWLRYHLAAVMAANFLPLFIRAGAGLLQPMARDSSDALEWLAPLVKQSVAGALDANNPLPFSGPAIRGDQQTLAAHQAYLAAHHPELLSLYQQTSQAIAQIKTSDP